MKLHIYKATIEKINNWKLILWIGIGFIISGLLLMLLSRPLGFMVQVLVGVVLIVSAVILFITSFAVYKSQSESGEKAATPWHSLIVAVVFLVMGILILASNIIGVLLVIFASLIIFIEGVYNFLIGLEQRKRSFVSYYYLTDGFVTSVASIVIMIIALTLLGKGHNAQAVMDKITPGQIMFFFSGLKFILTGCTMILLANDAKRLKLSVSKEEFYAAIYDSDETSSKIQKGKSGLSKKDKENATTISASDE